MSKIINPNIGPHNSGDNSDINEEDVTLHKLLFYSFQSVFFKNGFVDNGISKDILIYAFEGYSQLCMKVGGIFEFDKDTVYYYPFNAFPSIMEGGSNELKRYDTDNITDDLKNRSFMGSMKKLFKSIEGKMYEHHKAVHIIKLIVYTVFLIVVGVISLRLLFIWTGAITYTEQSITLGQKSAERVRIVMNSKTPFVDDITKLVKNLNYHLEGVDDVSYRQNIQQNFRNMSHELAVLDKQPLDKFVIPVIPPKSHNELFNKYNNQGLALYQQPKGPTKSSNATITFTDINKDNIFSIFHTLNQVNDALNNISNNPILNTVTEYGISISENIVTLKQIETKLQNYKIFFEEKITDLKKKPGQGILYGLMNTVSSMYDFTIGSILMQPTESPLRKLILVVTTIDEILGLIQPAMSEMTYKSTTISQSQSLAKSVFSLSLFFKGMMTIAFCITNWLLYKYYQKIKELKIENKVITHQKILERSGSVVIELFKLMNNKQEITTDMMEKIMNELIEGKGIPIKNIDTYSKMKNPKVQINISKEDLIFLHRFTSMINSMNGIKNQLVVNDKVLPIGINDALLNFMIAQFNIYQKRNLPSAVRSSSLLKYGGTKRKTKKSRKTKNPRKTRKTKKSRKTRKGRK